MIHEIKRAVLITGGSSGIGFALAEVFARNGHNLVIVSRNNDRLLKAADFLHRQYGVSCDWIVSDLSQPGSAYALYRDIKERQLTIDILVNNAGFGTWGRYWEIEPERSEQEMYLNMVSLAMLTKYFVTEMVLRGSGKILNVASTAAFQPGPLLSVYYATKSFVLSFSEALARELRNTGVTVTTLCPGPTATEFQSHAGLTKVPLFKNMFLMEAAPVAEKAYEAVEKGKRRVIPGINNIILSWIVRFLPKRFILSTVLYLHRKRL